MAWEDDVSHALTPHCPRMVHSSNIRTMFDVKVEKPFIEPTALAFTITPVATSQKYAPGFMPANVAFVVALSTGFIGAIVVSAIAVRFTRKLWSLAFGGLLSGAAFGVLMYVSWSWITLGFELIRVCMLPVAVLILLLVMTAQNWFVFYEDRHDVLQSSRPAIVVLAAIVASLPAWLAAGKQSGCLMILLIWAGAGSLAMLWCIDPVQRSIERTRSVPLGTLVGVCKVLLPLTGIVIFIRGFEAQQPKPEDFNSQAGTLGPTSFVVNLIGFFWDLGRLVLMLLVNGARVPSCPAALDPHEMLSQQKNGQSVTGEMPRLKRDSVVMIFVLALHGLCGVLIAKA
jgi:hypothetical protein